MNKARREKLKTAVGFLEIASGIVSSVQDAESDSVENVPENLQGSDRYSRMEEICEDLDEAVSNIDDAISKIESSIL